MRLQIESGAKTNFFWLENYVPIREETSSPFLNINSVWPLNWDPFNFIENSVVNCFLCFKNFIKYINQIGV